MRLARDACGVEYLAGGALLLGQRDEQMLARGVAVSQLLGDLHGAVDEAHERRARHAAHHHGAARAHLRHAQDLVVHVGHQLERLGADALDDGRQVVLLRFKQGLQHMDRLRLGCFVLGGDGDGLLQRLLGGQGQFVQVSHAHRFVPPSLSSNGKSRECKVREGGAAPWACRMPAQASSRSRAFPARARGRPSGARACAGRPARCRARPTALASPGCG